MSRDAQQHLPREPYGPGSAQPVVRLAVRASSAASARAPQAGHERRAPDELAAATSALRLLGDTLPAGRHRRTRRSSSGSAAFEQGAAGADGAGVFVQHGHGVDRRTDGLEQRRHQRRHDLRTVTPTATPGTPIRHDLVALERRDPATHEGRVTRLRAAPRTLRSVTSSDLQRERTPRSRPPVACW